MTKLTVENFSCLKSVCLQVAPLTVLIGPQGSGKSVLCKLNYFFCDLLSSQHKSAENGLEVTELKREIARQFRLWFPPSAWGRKRFNITFEAGSYSARLLRKTTKGKVTDDLSVMLSSSFEDRYRALRLAYADLATKDSQQERNALPRSLENLFRVRDRYDQQMAKELGADFVDNQFFIPAGRAFFTSMGRVVAAMKGGSSLDPVTMKFAELFANLRDRSRHLFVRYRDDDSEIREARGEVMRDLFGGELKFDRENEYVQSNDGRRIPFTALSSGQLELLPMWTIVDFFSSFPRSSSRRKEIFYIEEPEAHLFPAAQSVLLDFLVGALLAKGQNRDLILTTHSPYILSKLNNYLKAGQLGKSRKLSERVEKIVSKDCWLTRERVAAYVISDGHLIDLFEDTNLISATYIDSVSEEVALVFESLLDLEFPETAV